MASLPVFCIINRLIKSLIKRAPYLACLIGYYSLYTYSPPIAAQSLELVTLQYPPYVYQDHDEVKGIAVTVLKEAFRRIQQPVSIKLYPWARSIKMIEEGSADAIFTAYKTAERETFADFSNEVLMPQVISLFVLKDAAIPFDGDITKLAGYRFGLVRKISYGSRIDAAVSHGSLPQIDYANSGEDNLTKLLGRRFDILVSNKYGAWDILRQKAWQDKVRELHPAVEEVPSYIAFSKKRNLLAIRDKLDKALRQMKQDGSYDKLVQDYFYLP